ncbi:MAG: hypothetical protein LKJ86_00165 [Oscillibacter sp.]|nr:hypothetical protein [Oscillibacter sp.]
MQCRDGGQVTAEAPPRRRLLRIYPTLPKNGESTPLSPFYAPFFKRISKFLLTFHQLDGLQ